MTTLYRPVLIESAEQAEALPVGTWARSDVGGGIPEETVVRTAAERQPWRNGPAAWSSSEIVGWTALMPFEAEEVRVIEHGLIELDVHGQEVLYQEPTPGSRDYRRTEYHTPWEEA